MERADPRQPYFRDWYAIAQYKVISAVHLYWTCKCGSKNTTILDAMRLSRQDWKIRARCGRCHGSLVTLVDRRYYYYTPERLRQHLQ